MLTKKTLLIGLLPLYLSATVAEADHVIGRHPDTNQSTRTLLNHDFLFVAAAGGPSLF